MLRNSRATTLPFLLVTLLVWVTVSLSGQAPAADSEPEVIDESPASYYQLREQRDNLESELSALRPQLVNAESRVRAYEALDVDLDVAKRDLANEKRSPVGPPSRVADLERFIAETQQRIIARDREAPAARQELTRLQEQVRLKTQEKTRTELRISRMIDLETPRQQFKTSMSIAFTILVILGFFIIAGRDERLRRQVFSGEAGLQFITLFSLVIAIILFGIIGVLESRELSALLGGLSGYILGRNTTATIREPKGNTGQSDHSTPPNDVPH